METINTNTTANDQDDNFFSDEETEKLLVLEWLSRQRDQANDQDDNFFSDEETEKLLVLEWLSRQRDQAVEHEYM
jgi:hypothetical protein